jgi:hypothetical protein
MDSNDGIHDRVGREDKNGPKRRQTRRLGPW